MSLVLRKIYEGLLYKPDSLHIHPLIGITILFLQFGFLFTEKKWILALLIIFILFENVIFRNFKGMLSILWSILPLLVFIGVITFIFGGWQPVYLILSRIIVGALSFSFYFSVTNPSALTRFFERLRFPSKLALIPSLALIMIPSMAKDAEDTFNTLYLRGEIKGIIFSWLPRTLAIMVAAILYRSDFLSQALFFKGFGVQKRSHYKKNKFTKNDFFRIVLWSIFIILFVIFYHFSWLGFFS